LEDYPTWSSPIIGVALVVIIRWPPAGCGAWSCAAPAERSSMTEIEEGEQ
jgi:hypothetical protein